MEKSSTHGSKQKLLNAALYAFRAKGYAATRIEDVCEAAGLTKGSFFHHFKSKEDLALASAEHWNLLTGGLFRQAEYRRLDHPRERLLAYIDLRKALLQGELPEFTCLAGTMLQEVYATHPAIREACGASISGHAATLEEDIAAAMAESGVKKEFMPASLALHIQAVIQGAFILAKAHGGPAPAAECLDHLRRYLEMLFPDSEIQAVPATNQHLEKERSS